MKNTHKLYCATLKRLLIPTLIMGVMSIVSSLLYLGGRVKMIDEYRYGYGTFFRGQPTSFAIAPALVVFMFLGSIVLTYMAFSYLNKRNASDFYHALPYTRMENYWSRILAVLTYQIGVIALTLASSYVLLTVSGVGFNPTFFPLLLLGYTAGSLLVIGAVSVAMSITGTLLSNVFVSGLILFLPRMLLFVVDQFILTITLRRLLIGHMGVLLNPVYNIVTASLLDISRTWEYFGLSETLINPGSIIYTAALGAVYIMLAMALMKRRPSELAENGAANEKVAAVYSSLLCLPLLIYGVYMVNGRSLSSMAYPELMTLLIILAIAFVIFIVIGFALNAKWKAVLKSIPLFAVALAVAVGVVFGATLIAKDMASYMPDRQKIAYVRINENDGSTYRYKTTYDYNSLLASSVKFEDDGAIDLFYDILGTNIQQWQDQLAEDYTKTYSSYGRVICEFKLTNGRSVYRNLNIYLKDIDEIYDLITTEDAYRKAYMALPVDGEVTTYDNVDDEILASVWQTYQQEFNSMSEMDQVYLNTVSSYSQIFNYKYQNMRAPWYIASFQIVGYEGSTPYTKNISISDKTPDTADYYMQTMNARLENKFLEDLDKAVFEPDDAVRSYINIQIPGDGVDSMNFMYSSDISEEEYKYMPEALTEDEIKTIAAMLKAGDLSDISVKNPFAIVYMNRYGVYEDENDYYSCYVPLTAGDIETLKAMYQNKVTTFEAAD